MLKFNYPSKQALVWSFLIKYLATLTISDESKLHSSARSYHLQIISSEKVIGKWPDVVWQNNFIRFFTGEERSSEKVIEIYHWFYWCPRTLFNRKLCQKRSEGLSQINTSSDNVRERKSDDVWPNLTFFDCLVILMSSIVLRIKNRDKRCFKSKITIPIN